MEGTVRRRLRPRQVRSQLLRFHTNRFYYPFLLLFRVSVDVGYFSFTIQCSVLADNAQLAAWMEQNADLLADRSTASTVVQSTPTTKRTATPATHQMSRSPSPSKQRARSATPASQRVAFMCCMDTVLVANMSRSAASHIHIIFLTCFLTQFVETIMTEITDCTCTVPKS